MTESKDMALCAKYPKIFRDRNASVYETPMGWGIETGDGWHDIIDRLCSTIQSHVDSKRRLPQFASLTDAEFDEQHQTVAAQVKEKFGGLRFYADNTDDFIQGAISMAESLSYRTCETCGVPGSKRSGGWIRTLCDGCHTARR